MEVAEVEARQKVKRGALRIGKDPHLDSPLGTEVLCFSFGG